MSLRTALVTTAALASLACYAGQDPRIDYAFAAPSLDAPPSQVELVQTEVLQPITASKRVSVSFKSASVSDVLNWLQKQGISFIVDDSALANKHVTLNVVNQPLDNVVDALAASLGGHWENRSGIKVFRKGGSFFGSVGSTFEVPSIDVKDLKSLKELKEFGGMNGGPLQPVMPDMKSFNFSGGPFDQDFAEKLSKEMAEQFKGANTNDPEFWQKFAKELQENLSKLQGMQSKAFVFSTPSTESYKVLEKVKAAKAMVVDSEKLAKLAKSLTADQKALHDKQGYLKFSDLTPDQQKLLGSNGAGDFVYKFSNDGQTITIKSK